MLHIRPEQLAALDADSVTQSIAPYFRAQHVYLGKERFRRAVGDGVAAAEERRLMALRSKAQYVCLRFMLGARFEHDPQMPWVGAVPDDADGAAAWVDATFQLTTEYLGDVAGSRNEHFVRSLARARRLPFEDLGRYAPEDALERVLTWLNPQKMEWQRRHLPALRNTAATLVASKGITATEAIPLCAILMFLAGIGFAEDPQFPWAAEAFATEGDEAARVQALHRGAIACVNWYLEYGR